MAEWGATASKRRGLGASERREARRRCFGEAGAGTGALERRRAKERRGRVENELRIGRERGPLSPS